MIERRKYPRFNVSLYIVCILPKRPPEIYESQLLDLSKEGVKLSTDHDINRGTRVVLVIRIPKRNRPIIATARKLWSKPADKFSFTIGMRFLKIQKDDLNKLLNYAILIASKAAGPQRKKDT